MKKKVLVLIIVLSFILSMVAVGCSSSYDADSSDVSSTETEAQDDNEDVSSEEADAVDETEEETADTSEEETPEEETTGGGEILTAETEITDEDIQEVYASIKESIETRYLEPNNISPADFNWPGDIGDTWNSYRNMAVAGIETTIIAEGSKNSIISQLGVFDKYEYPSPSKEILDAALIGIIDWLDSKGDYDSDYFHNLFSRFEESQSFIENLIANITFN